MKRSIPLWLLMCGVGVLCAAISAAASRLFVTQPTDMDGFFWPSAEVAALGHPFFAYAVQGQAPYPNANGPLILLPLTPVVLLAQHLGWGENHSARGALAHALLSPFCVLMAWEAMRAIEAARGVTFRPGWRLAAMLPALATPPLWSGDIGYGHLELPIETWLVLLGARLLRSSRPASAGLALAGAALARSTAMMVAIPLFVVHLGRGRVRSTVLLAIAGLAAGLAVMVPFLAADQGDVIRSLVTYRPALSIGGGSFWEATIGGPLEPVGQRSDIQIALFLSLALAIGFRLTRGPDPPVRSVFALLTASTCLFPLLAKTVWPYYFTDPFVLSTIWWLGRKGWPINRQMAVPVVVGIAYTLSEIGTELPPMSPPRLAQSLVTSALLALTVFALVVWERPRSRSGPGFLPMGHGQLEPGAHPQLGEDVRQVRLDSAPGDEEATGDLGV